MTREAHLCGIALGQLHRSEESLQRWRAAVIGTVSDLTNPEIEAKSLALIDSGVLTSAPTDDPILR